MRNRLHYTFEAAVRSLLARPADVARSIGKSYRTLYNLRTGRTIVTPADARVLATRIRKRSRKLKEVAAALERAAEVHEISGA